MLPTLHLVGLPHTETTADYLICAYTQKLVKFCRMMYGRDRKIILYGGARNEAPCDEFVSLVSEDERVGWFGEWNPLNPFTNLTWDPREAPFRTMNQRAIAAIAARAEPFDLILLIAGTAQQPIAAAFPYRLSIEWGVGYEGIFSNYCAFESYAWMHYLYGKRGIQDGRYYDQVIPNFFDPSEFHLDTKDDYLLFIGRLTARKGPHVASQIAEACGRRLVVAGPGANSVTTRADGTVVIEADHVTLEGKHLDYVGPLDLPQRAAMMARAAAVIVPTLYLEPFGGVAVEAMLSGTAVVASDWGAFPETVKTGITGYRFRTLAQGVGAVEQAVDLKGWHIRQYALSQYSLNSVAPKFEEWFSQLDGLWGEGWTAKPDMCNRYTEVR